MNFFLRINQLAYIYRFCLIKTKKNNLNISHFMVTDELPSYMW